MTPPRSAALQGRLQLADLTAQLDLACRVAVAAMVLLQRCDVATPTERLAALQLFAFHPDVVALRRRLEHGVEAGR